MTILSSKRFLVPLFIQIKFSKDNATTKVTLKNPNKANNHGMRSVCSQIKFASGFSLLSTMENNFFLFVPKTDRYNNRVAPIISYSSTKDLECGSYGPTLKGFVSRLQPGHSTYVTIPIQ
jgi:hypothetical protein